MARRVLVWCWGLEAMQAFKVASRDDSVTELPMSSPSSVTCAPLSNYLMLGWGQCALHPCAEQQGMCSGWLRQIGEQTARRAQNPKI